MDKAAILLYIASALFVVGAVLQVADANLRTGSLNLIAAAVQALTGYYLSH